MTLKKMIEQYEQESLCVLSTIAEPTCPTVVTLWKRMITMILPHPATGQNITLLGIVPLVKKNTSGILCSCWLVSLT